MRRAIFVLLFASACSSSNSTGGAQGNADFSFANKGLRKPADKPVALGSDVTLCVRIHGATLATKATFDAAPGVVQIVGTSADVTVGDYFVVLHTLGEGTGKISVGDGMGKVIDSFDVKVSAIAKLDIPSNVDVRVARDANLDVTARNAAGDELYAPNAVEWTVDRPDITRFWDDVRNAPQDSTSGTAVQLRGIGVGMATVHGTYGKTMLSVPVTVK